jgi:hypothetical protein
MSEKTIIEVNGIKLEVDMRYARRIDEIRIGDKVKILHKQGYSSDLTVNPGIVVGFEPFDKLPTIVIAYVSNDWNKAEIKFLHFNSKSEAEIVAAVDDLQVEKEIIIQKFDRDIAAKQREIDVIEEQKRYFTTNFSAYWERVES